MQPHPSQIYPMVPWHSDPVPILARQLVKSEGPLSHLKRIYISSASYNAFDWNVKQVPLQPYNKKRVIPPLPVSDLS